MNAFQQVRPLQDESLTPQKLTTFKEYPAAGAKYYFSIRSAHSDYITFQLNKDLDSLNLTKKACFPSIVLSDKTYKSDEVVYTQTEGELLSFYKSLVGEEVYNIIASSKTEKVEEVKISEEEEETNLRYRALYLINQGLNLKEVSQILNIPCRRLTYYVSLAEKGKLEKAKIGRPIKISEAWYDELSLYLSNPLQRHTTLAEITRALCKKFNKPATFISTVTVCKMIKKLGYSYKRSRARAIQWNTQPIKERRRSKMLEYLALLKQNTKFIYLDETGFNANVTPLYGYSKIGETLTFPRKSLSVNYSVICAITQQGILGYQVFQGALEAEDFGAYLIGLLDNHTEIREKLDEWVFYMDNCPIHKSQLLAPFLQHMRIFYAPPYSPFLNPIEEFFGLWKSHYRKELLNDGSNHLKKISRALACIQEEKVEKFYTHTLSFIYPCILKKNI